MNRTHKVSDWLTDPMVDTRADQLIHMACIVVITIFAVLGTYSLLAAGGAVPSMPWSPAATHQQQAPTLNLPDWLKQQQSPPSVPSVPQGEVSIPDAGTDI